LREAERFYVDTGKDVARVGLMTHVGVALKELGDFPEARSVLAEVVLAAQSNDNVSLEAEARRVLGELERRASGGAVARREFETALKLYRTQGDEQSAALVEGWLAALDDGPPAD
jgi:hypothetical protein